MHVVGGSAADLRGECREESKRDLRTGGCSDCLVDLQADSQRDLQVEFERELQRDLQEESREDLRHDFQGDFHSALRVQAAGYGSASRVTRLPAGPASEPPERFLYFASLGSE